MPANWMDHAIASVAPRMAARRVLARQAFETLTRGYDGASKGRRTDGWRAPGSSADTEIGVAGALLRDRMRDLVRANPHPREAPEKISPPSQVQDRCRIGTSITER